MAKGDVRTAIILAGGRSSRMGADKSYAELGGKTLLERTIETLQTLFREIIVVTNRPDISFPGVRVVRDRIPYQGPLGGILAGLEASTSFYNFVVACDMPFISLELVKLLTSMANADVIMPKTNRGAEPLFAIYAKTCIPKIVNCISKGDFRIVSFFGEAKVRYISSDRIRKIDPEMASFFNINTQHDLWQAEERLHGTVSQPAADFMTASEILHIGADGFEVTKKGCPSEQAVTIYLNNKELVTVQASPGHLDELALGFLYAEGLLTKRSELKNVMVDSRRGMVWVETTRPSDIEKLMNKRYLTSGCGKGFTFSSIGDARGIRRVDSDVVVPPETINGLIKEMNERATLHREIGGVHCSALVHKGKIKWLREDIGRHNTFDKLLGKCYLEQFDTKDAAVMTTGRISYEMVVKAAKAAIPVVISRTSPTDLAVELADALGLTVVGYARGAKMNVYTGARRIVGPEGSAAAKQPPKKASKKEAPEVSPVD